MKKIKIFLIILIAAMMLCSCASLWYKDYHPINDYGRRIELVKEYFPEIYDLYCKGEVVIDDVFEYTDKNTGKERVHISYHYRQ